MCQSLVGPVSAGSLTFYGHVIVRLLTGRLMVHLKSQRRRWVCRIAPYAGSLTQTTVRFNISRAVCVCLQCQACSTAAWSRM